MRKRIGMLGLAMAILLPVSAQKEVMQQINAIKARAQEEHILTEQIMVDADDNQARELCAAGLLRQLGGGYSMDDIKPFLHHISMDRGEKKLVFIYLDKDDLGTPSAAQPRRNTTPTKVELRQERPAAAKVEQPQERPVTTAPTSNDTIRQTIAPKATTSLASQQQPFFMREVMSYSSASAVSKLLSQLKEQGRIVGYGPLAAGNNTDDCYLILFNGKPPYTPLTILSPADGGLRLNLRTREVDSLGNHPGCEAVWLRMKQ